MKQESKAEVIARLQRELLALQSMRPAQHCSALDVALGPIVESFPNKTFPTAAVHEFLSASSEDTAATTGFISGVLGALMNNGGVCLWIGPTSSVFAPALSFFEIKPESIFFLKVEREKELLWALEEGLKCAALAAVVGEVSELSFTASRRLQLATEQSGVTALLLRQQPRNLSANACLTRWNITSLSSELPEEMPGVGYPRWRVELSRVRNGRAASWNVEWTDGLFLPIAPAASATPQPLIRKVV